MQDHEIEKLKVEMETNARINRIFSLKKEICVFNFKKHMFL